VERAVVGARHLRAGERLGGDQGEEEQDEIRQEGA
jgi:hypothetical protein